jgi:hypothetical protein
MKKLFLILFSVLLISSLLAACAPAATSFLRRPRLPKRPKHL